MLRLSKMRIQDLIYPVGFYRNKAKAILDLSRKIIHDYHGKVPNKPEDLLTLKGVGRKTANLVLGLGFGVPSICVDTHVHRISNRLGWVKTRNPHETEVALAKIIPQKYWIDLNTTLVTFGQHICLSVSPYCSRCEARGMCKRIGVLKSR
jgi:endonuclease-3